MRRPQLRHTHSYTLRLVHPRNSYPRSSRWYRRRASANACDSIAIAGQDFTVMLLPMNMRWESVHDWFEQLALLPLRIWRYCGQVDDGNEVGDDFELVEDDVVVLPNVAKLSFKPSDAPTSDTVDVDEVGPPPKPEVTLPLPKIQGVNIRNSFPSTCSQIYAIISSE
ncbi:hypothetical protein L218DRAFT_122286 [Marasmius fiardii PR-910]|nr:hypothetical protein L218DRAFT_122286 [Marasmius fiardii PR-910]